MPVLYFLIQMMMMMSVLLFLTLAIWPAQIGEYVSFILLSPFLRFEILYCFHCEYWPLKLGGKYTGTIIGANLF
jgi:hypothetical protein